MTIGKASQELTVLLHYCISLSYNVKSIDVKGYSPNGITIDTVTSNDIERNKHIYLN